MIISLLALIEIFTTAHNLVATRGVGGVWPPGQSLGGTRWVVRTAAWVACCQRGSRVMGCGRPTRC